jgi:alkyl sulfatase BDS1-like metallo-beta-lactamase superfamily hydrolase
MGDYADTDRGFLGLCAPHGLYEVTEGIYQVRGPDMSAMTVVEGDHGVIVIDPLASVETAAAALDLYRSHRGDRPVTGVIYTHCHGDRFGGVAGIADTDVPILAPDGFMEHAISGNMSLYPPSIDVTRTGQEEAVDGVRWVFQLAPGTEAPAGMNLFLPRWRALCLAENASYAGVWSRCLTEAIALFGAEAEVVFGSFHRPAWGRSNILRYLSEQRDSYAYLHDQTLRLLNHGHTGAEIAEMIQLPPALDDAWHARGDYGSVSHHVQAIYQRYLGRFDGNPANLWPHPTVATAKRYMACSGGVAQVVAKAREFVASGDLRFAAQLLHHAVFADPESDVTKELLAQVYERLGHGAEYAAWRDFYFAGAQELRLGAASTPLDLGTGMAAALSVEQIFDTVAIRVDGPAAWHETITIDWVLPDGPYRTTLRHGVLIHQPGADSTRADLTLSLTKTQLLALLAAQGLDAIPHEGDPDALKRLLSHLDLIA